MLKALLTSLVLLITAFSLSAQQSTASPQVSTFTIQAPELNIEKKIWIYLPKSYHTKTTKKYPVLYMHDGQNLFDAHTSFSGEWEVDETLDRLNADVIVVGIEHGNAKRIEEYTPFNNAEYGGGKGDQYLEFLVNTLKPHIDKKYRTKTSARNTGIMGSSLGGLISFYAATKYPKVFGKVGVYSPAFWFNPEMFDYFKKVPKLKNKMYFLCGDDEGESMVPDMQKMLSILSENRCSCLELEEVKIVKGGKHHEKLWRDHFENTYLYLFK